MYLLDTNTSIHYLKNEYGIPFKVSQMGYLNCYLSELIPLEIRYGVANSQTTRKAENYQQLQRLETEFADRILLIRPAFEAFADQKARLRRMGRLISDFDLLIGCTALVHDLTLVTRNVREMERIEGLRIENWVN